MQSAPNCLILRWTHFAAQDEPRGTNDAGHRTTRLRYALRILLFLFYAEIARVCAESKARPGGLAAQDDVLD